MMLKRENGGKKEKGLREGESGEEGNKGGKEKEKKRKDKREGREIEFRNV